MPGPGPAPPLPSGPPPQHGYQPQQDQQAAHAAAWAAYYQSQGMSGAGPAPPTAGPTQPPQASSSAANPYANYGYGFGAGAQHSAHASGHSRPPNQSQGGYRPPGPHGQQGYGNAQGGPQQYGAQQPYQPSDQSYAGNYGPAAAGPRPGQMGGYVSGNQGRAPSYSGPPQQQRPPPTPSPYNAGPQQPFYPQHGTPPPHQNFSPGPPGPGPNRPFRPSPSPTPPQNRPFQPSGPMNRAPSGPARPPHQQQPPHQNAFPPAKRPRFDGPAGMGMNARPGPGSGPPGGMGMGRPPMGAKNVPAGPSGMAQGMQIPNHRPPPHATVPVRPQSQGSIRPSPSLPQPPHAPTGPSNIAGPSGSRSSLPAPPVQRPPIHLSLAGPPPSLPFGGNIRGGPMGRGMASRGGMGIGRGGLLNIPRGPSGMRRSDMSAAHRSGRDSDRKRKDKEREREREKEAKTTMNDFRIIGIEMKSLGWSWGIIDGRDEDEIKEEEIAYNNEDFQTRAEDEGNVEESSCVENEGEGAKTSGSEAPAGDDVEKKETKESPGQKEEVKVESNVPVPSASEEVETGPKSEPLETSDSVEGKRGSKRKAKTPEGNEEDGAVSKKRPGEYFMTHGKVNDSSSSASKDSNQNRFRIYFESPPELDRVPKALRNSGRNPNKRWRRETSSVAPDRMGDEIQEQSSAAAETIEEAPEAQNPVEPEIKAEEASEDTADVGKGMIPVETSVESEAQEAVKASTEETQTEAPTADDVATEDATEAGAATGSQAVSAEVTEGTGDISMVTDPGAVAAAIDDLLNGAIQESDSATAAEQSIEGEGEAADTSQLKSEEISTGTGDKTPAENSKTDDKPIRKAIASTDGAGTVPENTEQVSENAASPSKTRTRRRSSVSSVGSNYDAEVEDGVVTPSLNRLSILYEDSSRRLCFDAAVVERVKIFRKEGKIEVLLIPAPENQNSTSDDQVTISLPKGILIETYDSNDQRFVNNTGERLQEVWSSNDTSNTIPPLHKAFAMPKTDDGDSLVITVYLNKKKPLSEPKWCRTNSADEWLIEQFGSRKANSDSGWKGKLEIVDPDPSPTLQTILDSWVSTASYGTTQSRKAFTSSLLSDPNDLLEILLRLTRGDRNPTASSMGLGPLATAIRPDSPYASHQTHVSLAILAMYRLTTDYAAKAGEKTEVVNDKVNDIIKSLPVGMIHRSLEGLFKEWGTGGK